MAPTLVVVPTYMEAGNIGRLLRSVRAATPDANVLVVDDNSPDGTAKVAEALNHELGQISVLKRDAKSGLGPAIRAGLRWGLSRDFAAIVTMDADFSHDPEDIPRLLEAARTADLVIGSRYVPGGGVETKWPRRRKVLSRWGNVYVRLALRTGIADNTAGFRVYAADLLRRIRIEDSRADGYAFQIEAAYSSVSAGARVAEVPVFFTDRTVGQSKLSSRTIVEALGLVAWWALRARAGRPVVRFDHAGTPS